MSRNVTPDILFTCNGLMSEKAAKPMVTIPPQSPMSNKPTIATSTLVVTNFDAAIGMELSHWIVRFSFSCPIRTAPAPTAKKPGMPIGITKAISNPLSETSNMAPNMKNERPIDAIISGNSCRASFQSSPWVDLREKTVSLISCPLLRYGGDAAACC